MKIWRTCIDELNLKFRVSRIDLPGHGNSAAVKWDYSVTQGVDLLARCLPQTCSIIGWSLGGLVAQLYARQYPQRVTRLMLIASAPRFTAAARWPHGMREDLLMDFYHRYVKIPQRTLQKFYALQTLDTRSARQVFSELSAARSDRQSHNIRWGLEWLWKVDLRADKTLGALPVDLLHGEKDRVLPFLAARQTADIWKNTRVEKITDAGHAPFISHPQRFFRWLDNGIANK